MLFHKTNLINKFNRRYSAQVGAAVIAFVVTWIVLPTRGESMIQLDQQDAYKFRVSKERKKKIN